MSSTSSLGGNGHWTTDWQHQQTSDIEQWLAPRQTNENATHSVSKVNLEALFGLPQLTEFGETKRVWLDLLWTIEEPFLRLWRREYLHDEWTTTDYFEDPYPRWVRDDSPYSATIDADRAGE